MLLAIDNPAIKVTEAATAPAPISSGLIPSPSSFFSGNSMRSFIPVSSFAHGREKKLAFSVSVSVMGDRLSARDILVFEGSRLRRYG
jgi:hypothetical protein